MKKIKANKGITLIALVITIIVLLILAGVSIAMLTGDNGILTKANTAKTNTSSSTAKEKVQVAVMGSYDQDGNLSKTELSSNLEKVEGIDKTNLQVTDLPKTVIVDGYEVTIALNGTVTVKGDGSIVIPTPPKEQANKGEIVTGSNKEYTNSGFTAVVPVGFMIVPGCETISEGLVISDNPTDTEEGADRTKYVAEGNQFVWIPVENIDNFDRRAGYYNNTLQSFSKDTYKEPYTAEGYSSKEEGNTEIEEETAIRNSVKGNGGFYIGRYEAGKDGTKLVVKKNKPAYINVKWGNSMTDLGGNGAVQLSRNFVGTTYAQNQTTVKSTLIYGVQWDSALKFIDPEYTGFAKDSSEQGWYSDNYNATTGVVENNPDHTVGKDLIYNDNTSVIANKQKNIYDLAGNVIEWTMEAYHTTNRVSRGGNYSLSGIEYPASYRGSGGPGSSNTYIGFRVALYL